jgi:hypothetical protein
MSHPVPPIFAMKPLSRVQLKMIEKAFLKAFPICVQLNHPEGREIVSVENAGGVRHIFF